MGLVLPVVVAAIGVWIAFSIVVWATGRDTLLDTSPAGAPPGLGEEGAVNEAAVASVRFDTGMRGYRTDQVDAALTRLAWELGRKDEQLAELRSRVDGTGEEPVGEPARADADVAAEADGDDLFEEPLDRETFRLANESVAEAMPEPRPGDHDDAREQDAAEAAAEGADEADAAEEVREDRSGSEAGRADGGEATPRTGT